DDPIQARRGLGGARFVADGSVFHLPCGVRLGENANLVDKEYPLAGGAEFGVNERATCGNDISLFATSNGFRQEEPGGLHVVRGLPCDGCALERRTVRQRA